VLFGQNNADPGIAMQRLNDGLGFRRIKQPTEQLVPPRVSILTMLGFLCMQFAVDSDAGPNQKIIDLTEG
jgi:hypothetical protein